MKCTRNSFCEKEVEKVFCQGQSNPIFKTLRSALEPSSRKRVEVAEMRRIWCLHQRPWQKVRKNGLFCTLTKESIFTNLNFARKMRELFARFYDYLSKIMMYFLNELLAKIFGHFNFVHVH